MANEGECGLVYSAMMGSVIVTFERVHAPRPGGCCGYRDARYDRPTHRLLLLSTAHHDWRVFWEHRKPWTVWLEHESWM